MDFPYEPYEVQKRYMEKVLECLQNVSILFTIVHHFGRRAYVTNYVFFLGLQWRVGIAHWYGENVVAVVFIFSLAHGEKSRDSGEPDGFN